MSTTVTQAHETTVHLAEALRSLDAQNEYVKEYDDLRAAGEAAGRACSAPPTARWHDDVDLTFFNWELARELRKMVRVMRSFGVNG